MDYPIHKCDSLSESDQQIAMDIIKNMVAGTDDSKFGSFTMRSIDF